MPKRFPLTLPDDWLDALHRVSGLTGLTVSALMRKAIQVELESHGESLSGQVSHGGSREASDSTRKQVIADDNQVTSLDIQVLSFGGQDVSLDTQETSLDISEPKSETATVDPVARASEQKPGDIGNILDKPARKPVVKVSESQPLSPAEVIRQRKEKARLKFETEQDKKKNGNA